MSAVSPTDWAALAAAALAQQQLDPGYQRFVLEHLDRDDASWRWCCGSSCDPCVQKLGAAVDAVRALRAGRTG